MKKQFNIIYVLVSVLFLLAACTNLRDLKPEEFKTQEFFVGEKKVNRSVAEIANAFSLNGIHTDGVKQNARINIKPGNKEAVIWWVTGGLSDMATMALIECFEEQSGTATTIKIYAANSSWEGKVNSFIDLLK